MKANMRNEKELHIFLTAALDWREILASLSSRLDTEYKSATKLIK
jgi:hypothetical protein